MSLDHGFRIDVTNTDIRMAKARWLAAWVSDISNERVSDLYEEYAQLVATQARQTADGVSRPKLRLVR